MSDPLARFLARMLGHQETADQITIHFRWGAPWAQGSAFWILVLAVAMIASGVIYYRRPWQTDRLSMHLLRWLRIGALLALLGILADPLLEIHSIRTEKPLLWLLVDASESMQLPPEEPTAPNPPTRAEQWARTIADDAQLRDELANRFDVRAYTFAGNDPPRRFDWESPPTSPSARAAGATGIGEALQELRARHGLDQVAGLVVVSDFVENIGTPAFTVASQLKTPVFAVGVGPANAPDASLELEPIAPIIKEEIATIGVVVHQAGLQGEPSTLRLFSLALDEPNSSEKLLETRTVALDQAATRLEFPLRMDEPGRFRLRLELENIPGEVLHDNNDAEGELIVKDNFLRVLFVEYEPTWEWRFMKEVFHRDRLVGRGGFRTYLRSSDPAVRESNELFVPDLNFRRAELFQFDVIVIGDVPASALPAQFTEHVREFVSEFGGGLVVMAGPRFGPGVLAKTPLAQLLPVILDEDAQRVDAPFRLGETAAAQQFAFMRLGATTEENTAAWENLGMLPWYQPVRRVEETAQVLAQHLTDRTADGESPQPLIAWRPYGAVGGEVVYLGFNETWRLRRLHGEKFYRQFWAQLIHQLGLGPAQGGEKRFVVDPLPQEPIPPGEQLALGIRAWDANFEAFTPESLPDGQLTVELVPRLGLEQTPVPVTFARTGPGRFEAAIPAPGPGRWAVRVTDPVTGRIIERPFEVAEPSLERRVPYRNVQLQRQLASLQSPGAAIGPQELGKTLSEFRPPDRQRGEVTSYALASTWVVFLLIVGLLLAEWTLRAWWNLV